MIKCKECSNSKEETEFYLRSNGKVRPECKICWSLKNKKYRQSNKEKISCYLTINKDKIKKTRQCYYERTSEVRKFKSKEWAINNKDKLQKTHKQYRVDNADQIKQYNKQYREDNKILLREKQIRYQQENIKIVLETRRKHLNKKRKNNICFKLNHNISCLIRYAINKNGKSCKSYLPFDSMQLKQHLENQFEPWMTWNNQGRYNKKTWNDQDQSTWKWQIDHIVPHSILKYDSMEHPNFKKCWALSNLRPLSAKQNLLDGISRIRHKV